MLHSLSGVDFDRGFLWTEFLRRHADQFVGTMRLIRYLMLRPSSLRVSRLPLHPLAPDAKEYCLLLWITFDALDDPVKGA